MKPYSKIETLFERDGKFVVTEVLRRPILDHIKTWVVTEKVDGTNVRIAWRRNGEDLTTVVAGKTDNASLHPLLLGHCTSIATSRAPAVRQIMDLYSLESFTLYGEGYGTKIQNGGQYRSDQGFILFDALAGDKFLSDAAVTETAKTLELPRVPVLGEMSLNELVDLVKAGFESQCSEKPRPAEGVVARTVEPLYDNRGERLIIKLKTKDFERK